MPQTNIKDEALQKPKAILLHNPRLSGCLEIVNQSNYVNLLFSQVPNVEAAVAEYDLLVKLLHSHDVKTIELFDLLSQEDKNQLKKNPNLIFTRDSLITLPWLPDVAILGHMQKPVRRYETTAMRNIAEHLGIKELVQLPAGVTCEGGDIIPVVLKNKRIIFIRTGGRTSKEMVQILTNYSSKLCDEIVEIHCIDSVLHLDSMMGFAGKDVVVIDAGALKKAIVHTKNSKQAINLLDYMSVNNLEYIPVSTDEADRLQATNYINLGGNSIISYSDCGQIIEKVRYKNVEVHTFEGHELAKGRGGPRCLTRPIY